MADSIVKFRKWLADRRNFLFSRYTRDKAEEQEPERSLIELPELIRQQLVEAVEELPSNPADTKAVSEAIERVFSTWRDNPTNTNNSIVVLSSPITAVSRILLETLEDWTAEKQLPLNLLSLKARPYAIETITSKLEHELKSKTESDDDEQLEIVVVPNLGWCFLRSLDGLSGIDYLQSLLCSGSKNRFWIIGAGEVGWEYINSVCAIESYCGEVFTLPAIEHEELESWLNPIFDKLEITFDEPRIDKQIIDGHRDNRKSYFKHLADISKGVATVAVQAFLRSISYDELEDKGEIEGIKVEPEQSLIAQTPRLPNMPDLEPADQYILYSLLMHGDLTITALAESLGDLESMVQARIQLLRHEGIVEQRDSVLKINPIYYPKIKSQLAANNFIIKRD